MKLYGFPFSQHVRRVRALLIEADLPFEDVPVDLMAGDHRAASFLALNANGKVPVLVDGDLILHESNTILRYLCRKYDLESWYPTHLAKAAIVDQWMDWNQSRLSGPIVDVVLNEAFMGPDGDKDAARRGRDQLTELGGILEHHLSENAFLSGPDPTIADLSVAPGVCHLEYVHCRLGGDAVQAWLDRVSQYKGMIQSAPPPMPDS